MLDIQRYADLGQLKIDWLHAHYHFSFANYHNPKRMDLKYLRVINDDIVKAGGGFAPHGHRDMEIITYVRRGAITHEDSLKNRGKTSAGDIQVMAAGTGITHSEWNEGLQDCNLYQIWITPRKHGNTPRWETRHFPKVAGALHLLASGMDEHAASGAIPIDQDAAIWGGTLKAGQIWEQPLAGPTYMLISHGEISLEGETLRQGDGVAITDMARVAITAHAECELVIIEMR